MEPGAEAPRCANQIHVAGPRGSAEPTSVCSCAAGLIHMHDCPVTMGLPCVHFKEAVEPPPPLSAADAEDAHGRLMTDYLSRMYFHRIRSLAPAGNPWHRRREELYAFYATVELGGAPGEDGEDDDAGYEQERERLLELRRQREQARKEREEKTREERALERARLGIKTVVEKAQEAVAAQGAPAESFLDHVELPPKKPKRRRKRRGRGDDGPAPGPPHDPAAAEGSAAPPDGGRPGGPRTRKRRRRRRRKGPPGEAAS